MFTLADSGVAKDPMEVDETEKAAYFKELDKNGPYETKTGGQLTPDALLKLRSIICKHAYSKFNPRKQELMEERLGYFQQKNLQKYVECIKTSAEEYEKIMRECHMDALKLLDIGEKNYEASFLEARQNPEQMAKL